ncbi:hypothetical protein AGMMS50230_22900 [Spirochaetia bacterium]|nr:hypothetical protein AGMMS50230_22900 [Spirochaetia bacterium]
MANPELVRVMDFILNRCDEQAIEAVSAAVVRRRRELTMFGGSANLPDPKKMAREISGQINVGASIEGLRETVRDMAVRMIRKEAPELNDDQIAELTSAWIPGGSAKRSKDSDLPPEMLLEMTNQFVAFSTGTLPLAEENKLRREMGAWPERYWKAFPGVLKLIIKDYLDGEINEKDYRAKIAASLSFSE